jgi:hypothetical protein
VLSDVVSSICSPTVRHWSAGSCRRVKNAMLIADCFVCWLLFEVLATLFVRAPHRVRFVGGCGSGCCCRSPREPQWFYFKGWLLCGQLLIAVAVRSDCGIGWAGSFAEECGRETERSSETIFVTVLLSVGRGTNIGRERRHGRHVLDPRQKVKV